MKLYRICRDSSEKRHYAAALYSHQAAERASKALLYHVNEVPGAIVFVNNFRDI
jgi:HEPN domain-containing protein